MSWRLSIATVAMALALFDSTTAFAEQPPPAPPQKPAATKTTPAPAKSAPNPLTQRSADFWTETKKTQASDSFTALKAAVACNCTLPAAGAVPNATAKTEKRQRILDIAIAKPADAAKVLSAAVSNNGVGAAAVATVLNMTTSPTVRAEAATLVEPEAKARVQEMTANLSTGIAGLPGIYLSDSPIEEPRSAAPSGYTPVSGGSIGCSAR